MECDVLFQLTSKFRQKKNAWVRKLCVCIAQVSLLDFSNQNPRTARDHIRIIECPACHPSDLWDSVTAVHLVPDRQHVHFQSISLDKSDPAVK